MTMSSAVARMFFTRSLAEMTHTVARQEVRSKATLFFTRSSIRCSARGAFGGRGVFAGRRPCFLRYSFMYPGWQSRHFPWAVAALLPIRRIKLELLPVILTTPSTLAIVPAADHLVRMVPGRSIAEN